MMRSIKIIIGAVWSYVCLCKVVPYVLYEAYDMRLFAIREFGPIIHEFDPYFNLRATEYLYHNGWAKFVTWFDYKVWYPLGRPVGTTIYPGLQVTAVFIKNHIFDKMSINDVCVYIPAWFGSLAALFTGLIAYECSLPLFDSGSSGTCEEDRRDAAPFGSILQNIPIIAWLYGKVVTPILAFFLRGITLIFGSDLGLSTQSSVPSSIYSKSRIVDLSSPAVEIGLIAGGIMAIVPAHMMRSVGGGYDNESIAITAMTMTFYCWCRALRGSVHFQGWSTIVWGILTAISYFYMVAAWGGYVFVLNLIGVHAGALVLLGRFGTKLHRAYSIFYILGTFLATCVPVVGMTPLKSLEQLGPGAVFFGFQLLAYCEYQKKKKSLSPMQTWKLRIGLALLAAVVAAIVIYILDRHFGYFGPISSRIRGLFVKHTKTGNPLVDSVAEHQPAKPESYKQYLGTDIVDIVPYGFGLIALRYFHDSSSFLLVYGLTTYFFSHKMVRLILLTAPIASIFTGIVLGRLLHFFMYNTLGFSPSFFDVLLVGDDSEDKTPQKNDTKKKGRKDKASTDDDVQKKKPLNTARSAFVKLFSAYAAYVVYTTHVRKSYKSFYEMSVQIAKQMSNPTIIQKGTLKNGGEVLVDDYRECYWWLRDNTPEDARVMAWWDYGYQLTAIANRTTIADGNTWNHEHIALLGRALTSSEKEGHRIARHMADYMLVWAGGGGDDLAKSPHLARIANSVYRSMCPGDPTCSGFGYTREGPSPMMRESLLYKLVRHEVDPSVRADKNRFQHKFSSKYGKCRVFKIMSVSKESKEWVANPENRDCDAPGSWFCRGQYPPGMQKILAEKRDFAQLEDFNKEEDDSEYQKQYFENLSKKSGPKKSQSDTPSTSGTKQKWKPSKTLSDEAIAHLNSKWEDSQYTSVLWDIINNNELKRFMALLKESPELGHLRSADGRGPMWWAMEAENEKMIMVLKKVGVSASLRDAKGMTPYEVAIQASAKALDDAKRELNVNEL